MNEHCDCCGGSIKNKGGWRYYNKGNWYCKTNIRRPKPEPDDTSAYYDLMSFIPQDSNVDYMLCDHLEVYSELYSMRDCVGNYDYSTRMTYEEQIIAFFLEFHEAKNELLPVSRDYTYLYPKPKKTYFYGFGTIRRWLDPMHLISYDRRTNRVYALTCLDPQESFLYSVLDAYTFWEEADVYSLVANMDIPKDAVCRRGLLVDATQWLLGIWEPRSDVFGYNAPAVDLLKEFNIDMFELDKNENVIYAYYVNEDFYVDTMVFTDNMVDNSMIRVYYGCVIASERLIYGVDYGNERETTVIQEITFRYADYEDNEHPENYHYKSCTLNCPLIEMHVIADCLCKDGRIDEAQYNEYAATEQQIEIAERPGDFLANGCLTSNGMIIYQCSESGK